MAINPSPSFAKAYSQAPQGLGDIPPAQPDHPGAEPLEIEIVDPEAVRIHKGDMTIEMHHEEDEDEFSKNLAEDMDERDLARVAGDLIGDFETDISSRRDWVQTYVDGLELLGMKLEERIEPWPGACGVYHPLLTESVVKFQAETMTETFPAAGPVKTKIIGKETPEKKQAAERVEADMNYRLTEQMVEYRPEHERMLWGLGLAGNAFKKVYVDVQLDRPVAMYCPAEDVVVPYGASSLESAERVTHVMRKTENEVRRLQHEGFYRKVELGTPLSVMDEVEKKIAEKLGFRATEDNRFKLLEMHVELDLPGYEHTDEEGEPTGIALPYVVTIEKGTNEVLAIRRNWHPDDHTFQKRQHFVHYPYIPGFGFYAFGLIHLIGAFAKSGTSILRQLVDAGTLSNLPGGFKTRGLRTKGDDTPISPGEFRDVDVPSGSMRDNIMPLPYKEPSQVLATLLQGIIEEGRRFAGAADLEVSDMSAQAPVGTTLAILERQLKAMSAVQARVHYAMRQEFRLLKEIIRDYTPPTYSYDPDEGGRAVKQSDYDMVEVIPVSDPNAATMAQKVVQYQAALQLAQTAPQLYDLPLMHRQMLEVLGIKNYQKLVPMSDDMKPRDPVTENMNILNMKPVRAFMYQDHNAHITVHMAAAHDPHIQQLVGQNPQMAQAISSAMSAHIADHLGMSYRQQIEQMMGQHLPPYVDNQDGGADEDTVTPEMEVQISRMAAQAAQQLYQQNQQQAQAQQMQQQAQDPLIQLQQQELSIKQQDLQRKMAKDQSDAQAKQQQLAIEQMRINKQQETAGAQLMAKTVADHANRQADMQKTGFTTMANLHQTHMANRHDLLKQQMLQRHQQELAALQQSQQGSEE
jgi:hypothetical protein